MERLSPQCVVPKQLPQDYLGVGWTHSGPSPEPLKQNLHLKEIPRRTRTRKNCSPNLYHGHAYPSLPSSEEGIQRRKSKLCRSESVFKRQICQINVRGNDRGIPTAQIGRVATKGDPRSTHTPPHLPQSPENKQPTYIFGAYKCGSESDCPGIYQHATAWLGV